MVDTNNNGEEEEEEEKDEEERKASFVRNASPSVMHKISTVTAFFRAAGGEWSWGRRHGGKRGPR
ncbi:hypothetical protein X777_06279 [Ooceraea biroi]|uniref:Uncharacterized protein n=1 Tax=Ooceraea biroi TaxID=2015173 RepID=A0A026WAW7_OOCBI|nr:hypothetical protein X777_06279 [Ooceraea biroi]